MLPGLTKLSFIVFLVLQALVWSASRYGTSTSLAAFSGQNGADISLWRRSDIFLQTSSDDATPECAPLSVPPEDQCKHVHKTCEKSQTVLSIPYLHHYFCSSPSARPAIFVGLLVWLLFLFSTLGISASDFFCPNLATLAELLGLDENVAGVTFLAFGNGSPDVFSTFSAMRTNSGSLAIGELLGAATFIISVVVGSMCIIKPFHVDRKPFLRDVGFFTVAVSMILVILWDGRIYPWEAATLIGLYLLYVLVVVIGSWWDRRQFKKKQLEAIERAEFADEDIVFTEPYRDEPSSPNGQGLQVPLASPRVRAHSSPAVPPSHHMGHGLHVSTSGSGGRRSQSRSPSPSPRVSHMPSFSLVGALEFRDVVASLQKESAGAALSVFESPVTPYVAGHYHSHGPSRLSRRNSQRSSISQSERDPWDAALASNGLPLNRRSPQAIADSLLVHDDSLREGNLSTRSLPAISTTPASPTDVASETESLPYKPPSKRQRVYRAFRHTIHILFPTLHNMRGKSFLGKIASILAAPAVLALTITLPVTVLPRGGKDTLEKGSRPSEGRLIDFEEEGVERVLIAEEEVREEMSELNYNKWLMAVQCVLGPLFCVAVLFAGARNEVWLLIATAIGGSCAALLVLVFSDRGNDPAAQMLRCFMGFFVAVIWIMAIADEVVNVLKTFGFIFGLSDGIIGLTVFAVGNSLADFVANISVAAFAPIMGFSACFGGPMLNMLLGIGVSGSYILRTTGIPYYTFQFSSTLLVSTIGLLVLLCITVIFVPLNGFHLPKLWGVFLIFYYIIVMTINIIVEVHRS